MAWKSPCYSKGTKRGRADSPFDGQRSESLQQLDKKAKRTPFQDDSIRAKPKNRKHALVVAKIESIGIENLMNAEMRPRERKVFAGGSARAKINETDTRILKVIEWDLERLYAFEELISACSSPQQVKKLLADEMKRRQKDKRIQEKHRLARGVLLNDITSTLAQVRKSTNFSSDGEHPNTFLGGAERVTGTMHSRAYSSPEGARGESLHQLDMQRECNPAVPRHLSNRYQRAVVKIQSIGINNLMDFQMRPRERKVFAGGSVRAMINEADTRILEVTEWDFQLVIALEELIDACQNTEHVKSLLGDQMRYRQMDEEVSASIRLARGVLLRDINVPIAKLLKESNTQKCKRDPELDEEDVSLLQQPHKKMKHEPEGERKVSTNRLQQQPPRSTKATSGQTDYNVALKGSSDREHSCRSLNKGKKHSLKTEQSDWESSYSSVEMNKKHPTVRFEKRERSVIPRDGKDGGLKQPPKKKTTSASGNNSKASSDKNRSDTSRSKREPHGSPFDGENVGPEEHPQKKAETTKDEDRVKESADKKFNNPFLTDMLARNLDRLKQIKESMGDDSEQAVEGEAAKFADHFIATNNFGTALRALETTSKQDFDRACFDIYLLDRREKRARLAYERAAIAKLCADISKHLEDTIGLILEDHVKQQFLSVIP
ncbi:hypothetical protein HDK77DRAFT_424284 [Phyllosticta capitalensis]